MPPASSRVTIDLSSSLIRVLEGAMGGSMRAGSAALPEEAIHAGKLAQPAAVGQTLKQLLARTEIVASRALVAISDSAATTRVITLPEGSTDRDVAAAVAKTLSVHDPERIATQWTDVPAKAGRRVIYAVAWDRTLVNNTTEALAIAGIEPTVLELKSLAVTRTVINESCIVADLTTKLIELMLIDEHVPRVWHSFELDERASNDFGHTLAGHMRSMLRYHGRGQEAEPQGSFPILIAVDQGLPAQIADEVEALVGQPVRALPAPSRVPANVRHCTYLTCLGLMMRRGG